VPKDSARTPWVEVARSGKRSDIVIEAAAVRSLAQEAMMSFGVGKDRVVKFDPNLAKADLKEGDRGARKEKATKAKKV
jgi:hypothetical protein